MSDVFEEVEENLRQDQYGALVRRYGVWALAGLVALLAAVGAWQAYQSFARQQAGEYAQKLQDGQKFFTSHDLAGAQRYYDELAKSGPSVYRTAALQLAAEALYEQGDARGALAKLDQSAALTANKLLADAARLKGAYIAAELEDYKTVAPRLKALIDAGGPLSYQVREVLGAKAYEAGDMAHAREQYTFLSLALEAPAGLRERARAALAVLGPEPAAPPAKPGASK